VAWPRLACYAEPMRLTLTRQILLGLVVGILVGWLLSATHPAWAETLRPFSQIFLRLIKMLIAPLIFSSLVAGIAGAGHPRVVGRMGLRAMIYFEVVTTLALGVGLLVVNITQPGRGVSLPAPGSEPRLSAPQTWKDMLLHLVPESVIDAMAKGDVLQIVIFSIFFAIAVGLIGERGKPIVALCESVSEAMFKLTNIVMRYAPIGVGCAIAHTVGHGGLRVLWNLAALVGSLYLAVAVFIAAVLLPIASACGSRCASSSAW
jgi:proton glutamate symport protein